MGSGAEPGRHGLKHGVRRQLEVETSPAGWTVRQESDSALGTVRHHTLGQRLAKERIQPVLHRGHRHDRLRLPDFRHRDIRESDPADLPRVLELGQGSDTLCQRDLRVRRMQLIEIDALNSVSAADLTLSEADLAAITTAEFSRA